jgi:hypothetical protein
MSLFLKNGGQEAKTDPVWGLISVESGKDIRKGCSSLNMVGILCVHV